LNETSDKDSFNKRKIEKFYQNSIETIHQAGKKGQKITSIGVYHFHFKDGDVLLSIILIQLPMILI